MRPGTRWLAVSLLTLTVLVSGCGDDSTKPPAAEEPWAIPADTTRTVRIYSPTTTCIVGDSLEFKVIFNRLGSLFGAALEISVPSERLRLVRAEVNPGYFPGATVELPAWIDPATGRLAYGVSYLGNQPQTEARSGALLRFTCVAIAAGTAEVEFVEGRLEIRDAAGDRVDSDPAVRREGTSLVIR